MTQNSNIILTTPTASGKTLVYALQIFEKLLQTKDTIALFIYPIKVLTRDQLAALI